MERVRVTAPEGGRVMVKQSMAAETDINAIVARHVAHGVPLPVGAPSYGDFSSSLDYHSALNSLIAAQDEFSRLPASVRDYCQNDPGMFLDLVHDESRLAEMAKLGLVPELVPAKPVVPDPGDNPVPVP